MGLSYEPVGDDQVRFMLKLTKLTWVGFGISAGTAESMIGQGAGADVVVCSGGAVQRYWVTGYTISDFEPSSEVVDATCTEVDGSTILAFTRTIAAADGKERSLTPGAPQQFIYAYGNDGLRTMNYH